MTEHQGAPDPYGAVEGQCPTGPPTPVSEQSSGEPPSSGPDRPRSGLATQPRGRGRVASTTAVLALVLSLAGWGWFASENARTGWWEFGQHVSVEPDQEGWAGVDTVRVRLTGAEIASGIEDYRPPSGFTYLVLDFDVEATETETYRSCTVEVRDEQGRLFLAGREVPNGDPYSSELMCGTSDPADDPVPGTQSVLVLVPVDAALESVRVDSREFPAATFIELRLPF
ncbi:hypothetical protein [Pseudactinotalea sp.]|uniref:hypothetical protein n=1 Tax=Pseudactinotalea sp. TaxID=1926260 RepID=UPI003B3B7F20